MTTPTTTQSLPYFESLEQVIVDVVALNCNLIEKHPEMDELARPGGARA